jgi:hypothetical protein
LSLPEPTLPLPAEPPTVALPENRRLVRIYDPSRGGWQDHRFYGPLGNARFDHQPPPRSDHPTRSVWYASTSLRGAVAEAFGRLGFIDQGSGRRVVQARIGGPIRVLDLVGVAVRRLGLTQEIATTTDYALCQSYARAFYDQYRGIQGIRWRGREIGSINLVLNDRADMATLVPEVDEEIIHPDLWPRIARAARDCHLEVV